MPRGSTNFREKGSLRIEGTVRSRCIYRKLKKLSVTSSRQRATPLERGPAGEKIAHPPLLPSASLRKRGHSCDRYCAAANVSFLAQSCRLRQPNQMAQFHPTEPFTPADANDPKGASARVRVAKAGCRLSAQTLCPWGRRPEVRPGRAVEYEGCSGGPSRASCTEGGP